MAPHCHFCACYASADPGLLASRFVSWGSLLARHRLALYASMVLLLPLILLPMSIRSGKLADLSHTDGPVRARPADGASMFPGGESCSTSCKAGKSSTARTCNVHRSGASISPRWTDLSSAAIPMWWSFRIIPAGTILAGDLRSGWWNVFRLGEHLHCQSFSHP